jgi:hypothetical protein
VLIDQLSEYFKRTATGRLRASRIVPEPFFVWSFAVIDDLRPKDERGGTE